MKARSAIVQQKFSLDFSSTEIYECGALLSALLAYPRDTDANQRDLLIASLCAQYLRERYLGSSEEIIPQLMKPVHALRSEADMKKGLKTLKRRLRDRMVAAHVAASFLLRSGGFEPALPEGVSKLSLNQMTAFVAQFARQSVAENLETRIWRESIPVIHLAVATAVEINEGERLDLGSTSVGDILFSRDIIEQIIWRAQIFQLYIEADPKLPIDPKKLIKVQITGI
jgi:hypothetical protein